MSYLIFFRSSIGKKFIMAITGIFLIIFLSLHLSINLFLFLGEKSFNNAVNFMKHNIIVHIMEYILSFGFVLHILMGIRLHIKNKLFEKKYIYKKNSLHITTTFSSRTMIYTGILILCFLILHIINFTIPMKFYNSVTSDYYLVISLFKNPIYTIVYIISFCILGIHLNHGVESSLNTLGLSNNKHFWIKKIGFIYSLLICCGFSMIAIWFFFN